MKLFHFHKWIYEWKKIKCLFKHPVDGDIEADIDFKFRKCSCGKTHYLQPRPHGEWKDGSVLIHANYIHLKQVGSISSFSFSQ
jgi:hypothetical protein